MVFTIGKAPFLFCYISTHKFHFWKVANRPMMDKIQILDRIETYYLQTYCHDIWKCRKALFGIVLTCEVYFLFFHTADYLLWSMSTVHLWTGWIVISSVSLIFLFLFIHCVINDIVISASIMFDPNWSSKNPSFLLNI